MVERDIVRRGIRDERVLEAMRRIPRHLFVPPDLAESAYDDEALPLPDEQTVSQPYIVALMCEALQLRPEDRLLEIGTGWGYSAAVASALCREVYTVERRQGLAQRAAELLSTLGYRNVQVQLGDGTLGWPTQAPFDAICAAAAGPRVPPALQAQLAPQGRLVMPLGTPSDQQLIRITRRDDGFFTESLLDVRFVPLIGAEGWSEQEASLA